VPEIITREPIFRQATVRFEEMAGDRAGLESIWREIVEVCFVGGPKVEYLDSMGGRTYETIWSEPNTARRSRKVYDLTGALALDRVSAGIESMITPQGQQWHELGFEDPQAPQPTLDEEAWLDTLANYLFYIRYDPRSGWLLSHQRALTSTLALGTGCYYVEEAFGARDRSEAQLPFRYQPVPMNEAYLACNDFGEHDTNIRSFRLSARQAMDKFGDKNSDTIKRKAVDPALMDETSQFLHVVVPKEHIKGYDKDFPWTSIYIDLDYKHVIGVSGFYEFPYVVYTWTQPGRVGYGESPAMVALPEMKTVQVMSRDSVLASQLNIRPPVATAYELDRPVNLNPGAVNPKMIDPNTGRPLLAPVMPPTDPRLAETTIELRRQAIRQAMYTDLFAILVDKPNMSATEAAIRAQEKGELLGPAASRIQVGLSRLVDRENNILARKGAFDTGAMLEPPASVRGQSVGPKFVSPIDRARQLPEVTGMQQTLEFAAGLAQINPAVLDNFDTDAMLDRARYLLGAPPLAQKDPQLVERLREEKAQAAAQQQQMQMTTGAIEAAGGLGPAAEGLGAMSELMQNAGIDPSQVAGLPGTEQ
jgi:hypothetical protein